MDIFYTYLDNIPKGEMRNVHHLTGRKLVEYAAKNIYKIDNPELQIINNKPFFKYSKKQFSISHSKNIVLVCFSDFPVGADVEYIAQRDYSAVAKRMKFHLTENTSDEFYRCWTLYEAEFKIGGDYSYSKSFKLEENYMLSVVSADKFDEVNLNKIQI